LTTKRGDSGSALMLEKKCVMIEAPKLVTKSDQKHVNTQKLLKNQQKTRKQKNSKNAKTEKVTKTQKRENAKSEKVRNQKSEKHKK